MALVLGVRKQNFCPSVMKGMTRAHVRTHTFGLNDTIILMFLTDDKVVTYILIEHTYYKFFP